MDFHNGILCCGFLCARIIPLNFSTLFLPLSCVFCVFFYGYHAKGCHAPIYSARAITPSPLHGYHACVFTSRLPRHSSEFHFWVITPELSRSTTHVNRVITPALVSSSCLPITGYSAFFLHLHHHRGATRTYLLHTTPVYAVSMQARKCKHLCWTGVSHPCLLNTSVIRSGCTHIAASVSRSDKSTPRFLKLSSPQ